MAARIVALSALVLYGLLPEKNRCHLPLSLRKRQKHVLMGSSENLIAHSKLNLFQIPMSLNHM